LVNSLISEAEELKQRIYGLEKQLLAAAIEWARNTYKAILEQLDLFIQRYRAKVFSIEHKRSTWFRTWLGPIRITRRQYRDRDGKYHYLLDELLGMKKYRHTTTAVQEMALELAGTMTFRKSAEMLRKTTAIDLSAQTIHRLLRRAADGCIDSIDRDTDWFQETGELTQTEGEKIGRLMIEADGVMLSLQREKARKTEVKLGITYEGWNKVGKDRYSTVNKTVYADIAGTDRFWARMTLKLHEKYDLSGIKEFVIGGDGAGWIKEGVDYFGGTYQLCRYHLNRELCHALGHNSDTLRSVQGCCNRGEFDTALVLLKEAADKAKGDKGQDIRRAIRYISSNADGLKDYREDAGLTDKNLRRTGAIEGNIDKLIVRRMKNQGMSWTRQGIRRMLWLRISIHEGTLPDCLLSRNNETVPPIAPTKRVNHVIDRAIKYDYTNYFSAGLPAISGPHASRPWVELLKSLTRVVI